MLDKKFWIFATASIGAMAIAGLIILTGTFAIASNAVDSNFMAFIPLVLNQSSMQSEPSGEVFYFTPRWELGASSADPSVGSGGTLRGWYTREVYENGTKIQLELFIHVRAGFSGIGTGSYEIYLPDTLEPASDWFTGHANVWIAGGGVSEFDGSMKWTMRNTVKGPKLIFTFNGSEWSPTHPKNFADLKMRANIEYWVQPMDAVSTQLESSLPPK